MVMVLRAKKGSVVCALPPGPTTPDSTARNAMVKKLALRNTPILPDVKTPSIELTSKRNQDGPRRRSDASVALTHPRIDQSLIQATVGIGVRNLGGSGWKRV